MELPILKSPLVAPVERDSFLILANSPYILEKAVVVDQGASGPQGGFAAVRSGNADFLDDPYSTEVRSQARFSSGSNGVYPPTDLDVIRSHRLCHSANQIRVGSS